MNNKNIFIIINLILLLIYFVSASTIFDELNNDISVQLDRLNLPEGYKISVYARIPYARQIDRSPSGILYVGSMDLMHLNTTTRLNDRQGVYAIRDLNNDNVVDETFIIVKDLDVPCGVQFRDNNLYVSLLDKILVFKNIEKYLINNEDAKVIDLNLVPEFLNITYPPEVHHGWKFIRFGPDGALYIPVGAPCNICNVTNLYGTITRVDLSKPNLVAEVVARGVRNSVGFDFDPITNDLWFTENGRDDWGNDTPPDELNHVTHFNQHFGFPYCYGKNLSDPAFFDGDCIKAGYEPAAFELGPHVAAIGMIFYRGNSLSPKHSDKGRVFIAEHGSWNRDKPIGYRITTVNINDPNSYEVFIDGWLDEDTGEVWGRPTNILELPDESLLIADDIGHAIYRVVYSPAENTIPDNNIIYTY